MTKNVMVFIGTTNPITHEIVSNNSNYGICLNLYHGFLKVKKAIKNMKTPLFLDNGSFERFMAMLKGDISPKEYFDYDMSLDFFKTITEEYEKALKYAPYPNEMTLTIPEVIGSTELTQKLQKQFIGKYKEFVKEFNCKIIISLQFNPNEENWINQVDEASQWLSDNAPKNWIIGIPFGLDFKIISGNNKKAKSNFDNSIGYQFKEGHLKGYKAHLFACGSPTKIERFVIPNTNFVYSIDASTIMNLGKNSHYLCKESKRVIDIRYLTGNNKNAKAETIKAKQEEFEKDSNIPLEHWIAPKGNTNYIDYNTKFEINLKNFIEIYKEITI